MPIVKPGAVAPKPVPTALKTRPAPVASKPNVATEHVNGKDTQTGTPANDHHEVKETVLQVQRRYPGAEDTEEVLDVRTFATRTASVSVSAKSRIGSIGQGGEVSVMVTTPCYVEELDNAKAWTSEKVGEYLTIEQERLVELAGPEALAQAGIGFDPEGLPETGDGEGEAEIVEEGAEEAEEAEAPTEEAILALETEDEVVEFCALHGIEIDMTEYADVDAAKAALVAYVNGEEAEEVVEESAEAGEGEEATGYTEEELTAFKVADLVELFKSWGIDDGKAPARKKDEKDPLYQKRLVARVMRFQEEIAA